MVSEEDCVFSPLIFRSKNKFIGRVAGVEEFPLEDCPSGDRVEGAGG